MFIATTVDDLRAQRRALPGRVAFVPTMGALHAGHVSLIEAGHTLADEVIVSIFVNPTQFAPHEDLAKYPRPLDADLAACQNAGVAGVFVPTVEVMYPPGVAECVVEVPAVADDLEGRLRPGHFRGVCRVCAKLFNMVQPDLACFGMKDYQQLKVIEAMAADLAMPLRIVPCPTKREDDGLAMSSRNVYLSVGERKLALGLSKALREAEAMILEQGETDPAAVEAAMNMVLKAHEVATDYAVLRHPQTLAGMDCIEPKLTDGVVALIAGRVGKTRLIDNRVIG